MSKTQEEIRLEESRQRKVHWKRWGPYLSERQWGTVREDYSPGGTAWDYFPHDHARSRAYRWGEDGIAGICDRHQILCIALALWNGRDPILKERLFGLTGNEGNHGEDVKEYYYYLDSTPTHSYMKCLYKYPQAEFPYAVLVEENKRRGRDQPEFELVDTGIFDDNRYFDVFVEYAKESVDDIAIRITACNRGPQAADLHLLPHIWYRNRWSWGRIGEEPGLETALQAESNTVVAIEGTQYGKLWLVCEDSPELLFTNNETNNELLFHTPSHTPYVKDAFHRYVIHNEKGAVNPGRMGTKCAALYKKTIPAGGKVELRFRFTNKPPAAGLLGEEYESVLARRMAESEEFYHHRVPAESSADLRTVQRQAFAGMLWSKQFYHYDVGLWLDGDPGQPPPPEVRKTGRNAEWRHLNNSDVISMPDKWEYPWYAAWDLGFHTVTLALVDPDFAKDQLILMLREWYMHPSGQLPAYEWAFSDVNPPVHAWAAWRVYKIEKRIRGKADFSFLARVFHKLLLNFTWWVNRKDYDGKNVFQGGFLGLDNIGVFDRSKPLPTGGFLAQSDGTSWMAMYCLNMLAIALELARVNKDYEDVASKFFEHFVRISQAMNNIAGEEIELWDQSDGFYYDVLHLPNGSHHPLRIRSMVGLIPLFAVETLEPGMIAKLPGFTRRMNWFIDNVPGVRELVDETPTPHGPRRLLSLVNRDRLTKVMNYLLDPEEFLSPYGVRALSKFHQRAPYVVEVEGVEHRVDYEPGESTTGLFGGNSNWRGPIWFPLNFLLIESLQKFHHYFGNSFKMNGATLWDSAAEISRRLNHIFLMQDGRRAVNGDVTEFNSDPYWRDLVSFYEYFHGDNGRGVGASHQTGWTGLVAKLLEQSGG